MHLKKFRYKKHARLFMGKLLKKFYAKYKRGLNFKISTNGKVISYEVRQQLKNKSIGVAYVLQKEVI